MSSPSHPESMVNFATSLGVLPVFLILVPINRCGGFFRIRTCFVLALGGHSFTLGLVFRILFVVVNVPQVFSNDGQFKLRFGVRGRSPGQLQRPTGVTVDMNGDIIVADYDNRWITIFSSDGKFKVSDGEFVNSTVSFPGFPFDGCLRVSWSCFRVKLEQES